MVSKKIVSWRNSERKGKRGEKRGKKGRKERGGGGEKKGVPEQFEYRESKKN
jgi:hypothetical protein